MTQGIEYRNQFQKNTVDYERVTSSKYIQLIYDLEKGILDSFFGKIESSKKDVMDFACGSGRWTRYLEQKFKATVGVDVSNEMINLARVKCHSTNFILSDITMPTNKSSFLNNKQFDVITAFRFYKNAQKSLRKDATEKIGNFLKKDGYFIFDLHLNSYSFMGIAARILKFFKIDKIFSLGKLQLRTISLYEIKNILEQNDFEIVDYYGMGLLPSRSNFLLLPKKILYRLENWITKHKVFRLFCYNLLIIAQKKR